MDLTSFIGKPVTWNFDGKPVGEVIDARCHPESKEIQLTLRIDSDMALTNYIYGRTTSLSVESES